MADRTENLKTRAAMKRDIIQRLGRILLTSQLAWAASAIAQDGGSPAAKPKDGKGKDDDKEYLSAPDDPIHRKVFSSEDKRRFCERYDGKLIAYYGDVWKVEHCRRRPIVDSKTVYTMQRAGNHVVDVDADVIAALREGTPLDESTTIETARGCKALEGHYVTFSAVDVYFVEHCKKRMFPDWTTYVKHRDRREDKTGEILSLSLVEFDQILPGQPIPSVVDDLFTKLLTGAAGVDVIPVDEACDGLEGRVASYYSRLYRVEHCKKREIVEPDLYLKHNGGATAKVIEMKSDQWLSLPDGVPIVDKSERKQPTQPGKKTAKK